MTADLILVGGGLSGGLIALCLKHYHPELRINLIEKTSKPGGDHFWSFHETDIDQRCLDWLTPLIAHQWSSQEVRFPDHQRVLPTGYRSVTAQRLRERLEAVLGDGLLMDKEVEALSPGHVALKGGGELHAGAVIDCRGQRVSPALRLGFQKFVGQIWAFDQAHEVERPVIMDARVDQLDGYRFLYLLPLSPQRLLVEDTRYADGDGLDEVQIRGDIADYLAVHQLAGGRVEYEEQGVLPIALAGDIDAYLSAVPDGVGVAGMAAGLFHPLTGYSLPLAAALAMELADCEALRASVVSTVTRSFARQKWQQFSFYRLLTRMLFLAAKPDQRYKVLQRFYRLPGPLIERFYAGRTSVADKLRILAGKPPVPLHRAVQCLSERAHLDSMNG